MSARTVSVILFCVEWVLGVILNFLIFGQNIWGVLNIYFTFLFNWRSFRDDDFCFETLWDHIVFVSLKEKWKKFSKSPIVSLILNKMGCFCMLFIVSQRHLYKITLHIHCLTYCHVSVDYFYIIITLLCDKHKCLLDRIDLTCEYQHVIWHVDYIDLQSCYISLCQSYIINCIYTYIWCPPQNKLLENTTIEIFVCFQKIFFYLDDLYWQKTKCRPK